jgi:hypothetical protein
MELESRLYHKYANLFELNCNQGKFYEVNEPLTEESRKNTVYFNGRYYTFLKTENSWELTPSLPLFKSMLTNQLFIRLRDCGYWLRKGDIVFREDDKISQTNTDIFEMYQGFKLKTVSLFDRVFICVDPHLVISTRASIGYLLEKGITPEKLSGFSVRFKTETEYFIDGFLVDIVQNTSAEGNQKTGNLCHIKSYRDFKEETIIAYKVFPESRPEVLQSLLDALGRKFNIVSLQRQYSFLNSKTASIDRLKKTLEIVKQLQQHFPLKFGDFNISLEVEPARVKW